MACIMCLSFSCNGGNMADKDNQFKSFKEVSALQWEKLAKKKIYFGHQSVGYNILDGVRDLMRENPDIKLNIVETADRADFNVGIFAHSKLGDNYNPISKLNAFAEYIDNGIGGEVDFIFMKFCYLDFNKGSDSENIFSEYKTTIYDVKKKHPKMKIIHVTTPLLKIQTGPKAWVKKIIGRPLDGTIDNIKRYEFNRMIINEFRGMDPIFDLAGVESTYPDGTRESFEKDGNTYYAMIPEYTHDGGHLNELGRKKAAKALLLVLVGNI